VNNIASILVSVITSLGKQVPQDCEIVCFDYPDEGTNPPLFTHVQQDEQLIGKKSVDLLLAQLKGEKVPLHNIVNHQLITGVHSSQAVSKVAHLLRSN